MASAVGTSRIGAELRHRSQGYPFVAGTRLVNVSFLFLLGVGCLVALTGCTDDESGIFTADPATDDPGATTTTSDPDTDGATSETAPDEPSDTDWAEVTYTLEMVAETDRALAMAVRPGDDDLWLAERDGRVRVVQAITSDGQPEADPQSSVVLDITARVGTDGEGGLLGLDFSPDGERLYVSYTGTDGNSMIAEYRVDGSGGVEDTERIILEVEQPFSNHNGGQITVGPDGFLYVALGDGGSGGDPLGSGQDTSTLLGSILRIDPEAATADDPYGVPVDNPFVGDPDGRNEIWLYGVRNPWRFSFDADTGDLWIADVGQGEVEEVNVLEASGGGPAGRGANLGWSILEGPQPFSGEPVPSDVVGPIAWYGHDGGRCSVTGGYVYRGDRIPVLGGVYLFGDYCSGEVFGIRRSGDGGTTQSSLAIDGDIGQIVSFGQGPDGELFVIEANGTVSRLSTAENSTGL